MKENRHKGYIIITSVMLVILLAYFMSINLMKVKYNELPEVKPKEKIERDNAMAIMVTNDNGTGYIEYNQSSWPSKEYKFKEAKCIDNNGNSIEEAVVFNDKTRSVTLTTNSTIYCTLYFEKPIITYLRNNDKENNLSKTIQGDMYRYQGTNEMVDNNYICFGTDNKEECTNDPDGIDKYMYRIIGIGENENLKLIKETFLTEEDNNQFAWNNMSSVEECGNDGINCTWPKSMLFKRLNGLSNGDISGAGTTVRNGNTNIFVDSNTYDYLISTNNKFGKETSKWYNLIEDHNWLYGDICVKQGNLSLDANEIYLIESAQKDISRCIEENGEPVSEIYKWSLSDTIKSKIGLMYIHDFYFSYYDGNNENTRGHASNNGEMNKSWLAPRWRECMQDGSCVALSMTRYGYYKSSKTGFVIWRYFSGSDETGDISTFWTSWIATAQRVQPVFYLNDGISLNGRGTRDDPYIIKIN